MAKKLGIIVVVCCALALAIGLQGCGGADKSNYVGDWKLASSTDANLDADSIALMQSINPGANLSLKEDGTGFLNLFNEVRDVKWEAKSNAEGTLSADGVQTKIALSDDKLSLEDVDGASLTFSRA